MDSTVSTTTSTISAISKTLSHRRPTQSIIRSQLAFLRLPRTLTSSRFPHRSTEFNSISPSSYLRSLTAASAVVPPLWSRLGCVSSSAASFASCDGAGGGVGGNGDGGGDGSGGSGSGGAADGRDVRTSAVPGGADDVSASSSDVIILDVGGMSCGGCAASVKRILESQPQVSSASVNLTTEAAIIWPISEAKVAPNWQKNLGDELAKHLTTCGFKSNPRDYGRKKFFETFERKVEEKHNQLKESGRGLAVSWALCAVCLVGHLSHFFGLKAPWLHVIHSTGFHLSLSLFTLLGPGRQLIVDGLKSLIKGAPNMNTLVGLGAVSSFAVSSLAAFIPKLGWKAFFEEPVMLIAFVLLGRNIEQRAKIKATSDMTGLLSVLPSKARLVVNGDAEELSSVVEVSCDSLFVGDQIVILPGVAGHFTYGVMALSAATFMFWNLFGARILPATLHQDSAVSLALQLSCSVLVVACPCALGLATPTAVLVGTSLGATKGLLLRGGSILEKFSAVNTVVFDKTGTLTIGKPVVTKIVTQECERDIAIELNSKYTWSEADVLRLAAGVESNTIHPIGKAIVRAARAANCLSVKVEDGTFMEEPVSGALATIGKSRVSIGSLKWVKRHGVLESPFAEAEEFKNQSVVYVGVDGMLAGLIYVEDQIRDDAAHVVQSLLAQGIGVYLLSGDKKKFCRVCCFSCWYTEGEGVLWSQTRSEKELYKQTTEGEEHCSYGWRWNQ